MILEYNLQFFAKDGPGGEKTEPATPKKLDEARKNGQVAKSREIANGTGLMALFLVLKVWAGKMGIGFLETFESIYNRIPQVTKLLEGTSPIREMSMLLRQIDGCYVKVYGRLYSDCFPYLSAYVCSHDFIECFTWDFGESCTADEYVFCGYAVKSFGRTYNAVCNHRNDSGNF